MPTTRTNRVTLIRADGSTEDREVASVGLKEAHAAVGGYVELLNGRGDQIMLVNEEGKLRGLPRNDAATILARRDFGLPGDDWIVGDVLVMPSRCFK